MAKVSELMLKFQEFYAKHGDMAVVFRDKDDQPHDILSTGMSLAEDITDKEVKVCWVADRYLNELEEEKSAMD